MWQMKDTPLMDEWMYFTTGLSILDAALRYIKLSFELASEVLVGHNSIRDNGTLHVTLF